MLLEEVLSILTRHPSILWCLHGVWKLQSLLQLLVITILSPIMDITTTSRQVGKEHQIILFINLLLTMINHGLRCNYHILLVLDLISRLVILKLHWINGFLPLQMSIISITKFLGLFPKPTTMLLLLFPDFPLLIVNLL